MLCKHVKMPVTSVCLLSALVLLSVAQLALSSSCFCTNKDSTLLYNDEALTTIATEVSKFNTCFLGTRFTEDDESRNTSKILIEELSFGRCGIGSVYQVTEGDLTDILSNINLPPPYFGLYDDFFEIPLEDIKKRFLLDVSVGGFSVWAQWSDWGQCNASSCYDPGEVVRTRLCKYVNDNKTPCVGPDKEVLECNVSCVTGVAVGWSGWMPWNECDSDNCLSLKTSRTRLCFASTHTCFGKSEEKKQCTQDLCAVDGGWTEWSQWTGCTNTMSILSRDRKCSNPKPSNLGKNCAGNFWEIRRCPDALDWNAWESWGSCRRTSSGLYIQFRNRSCAIEDRVDTENSTCHENERLSYRTCQFYGTWNSWSSWSSCSLPSNQGTKTRSRTCNVTTAVDHTCIGNDTEEVNCTDPHVILPTEWSNWSDCYQLCNGQSQRNRACTENDAKDCLRVEERRQCSKDICIVDGNWSVWSEWYNCTRIDEHQVRTRNRTCDNPPPNNGGIPCFEASTDVSMCNKDAEWGSWQSWQNCLPVNSLNGVRFRYRKCHYGTNVISTCSGEDFDREACKLYGSWNPWGGWSSCSVTCENGELTRTRTCEKKDDMKDCIGDSTDTNPCTASPHCPVNGGYTMWSKWSPCPVTCGPGAVYRTRYCTNPTPAFGGQNCFHLGETVEASFCNVDCPIDGHWGSWLPWGACTASCNHGVKIRERKCDNPPASNGGLPCEGVNTSTDNCTLPLCSVDGKWSMWSEWSQCSCDHYHGRHRDCNNPTPVGTGLYCAGNATEKETCKPNPLLACPINGGWGEWLEWSSKCSVTCAQGVTKRFRQCSNPVPANGGVYCKGALFDERPCGEAPCPFDGVFSTWSSWGLCSVTCGNGTQERNRTCDPPPMYGGADCTGDYQEHKTCVQNPCPIDGGWSDWGSWSNWDKTCSFATRIRSRDCDNPAPQYHGRICIGEFKHTESTDLGHCPVDGNWGSWESWTRCSVTCLEGTHSRVRKCDSPSPAYNGSDCVGNDTEVATCMMRPTCVIDGGWAEWTEWFECSTTCGPGENTRYRMCTNPKPQNGGKTCPGAFSNTKSCNVIECPVDGNWTTWSTWSACSVTCEGGTQSRSRSCTAPSPQFGGLDCQGMSNEIQPCTESPCPIDGGWSDWGTWSNCAATCGNTTKSRVRVCNNPKPANGGSLCVGNNTDEIACVLTHCPIDGQWAEWSAWNKCSVTCGNGTQSRDRSCSSPAPQFGGQYCNGEIDQTKLCSKSLCPINGAWSDWLEWSSRCSVTCGQGVTKRYRLCTNPIPKYGGDYCTGSLTEEKRCDEVTCPIDGQWGDWSDWSTCSCNDTRVRQRDCDNPTPVAGGKYCVGNSTDTESCQQISPKPCPINGGWSEWLEWSSRCSVTCGQGVLKRYRPCANPIPSHGGEYCQGALFEEKQCNEPPCTGTNIVG